MHDTICIFPIKCHFVNEPVSPHTERHAEDRGWRLTSSFEFQINVSRALESDILTALHSLSLFDAADYFHDLLL